MKKLWYLFCGHTREHAMVYAYNEKEAFEKLNQSKPLKETDYDKWQVEEFAEGDFDGVLYFG